MSKIDELFNLIDNAQKGNKESMQKLFVMFTPLLKKYSNRTINEDAFSELTLSFLQCIKKIPLEKVDFKNDAKYILSYINFSIKNAYIHLNIETGKYKDKNIFYDEFNDLGSYNINNVLEDFFLFNQLKLILTDDEYKLVYLRYKLVYSDIEIGQMMGITRQAVHKKLKKIYNKIQKSIYKTD